MGRAPFTSTRKAPWGSATTSAKHPAGGPPVKPLQISDSTVTYAIPLFTETWFQCMWPWKIARTRPERSSNSRARSRFTANAYAW